MNKIVEKYLKSVQDENVSSAAGLGFRTDNPHGFVQKIPYPKSVSNKIFPPSEKNKKIKKKEILIDEQTDNFRHKILIDLDGVIHLYDGNWNNGKLGEVIKNAKESIDDIHNSFKNVDIIIYTTRACKSEDHDYLNQIENVKKFLDENDIYYDDITGEKLGALIYIDDNGYHFTDWKKDLPEIKNIIKQRIIKISG
jgi:hypothetical protein